MEQTRAALLLLSDGRLPAGGYAHSGTLEPLIRSGRVGSVDELARFLEGRAETAGFVAATVAACACHCVSQDDFAALTALESEFEARTPAEELRSVSRRLGRQLLRVMSTIRPHPFFEKLSGVQHQPVIMGVAAAALGLSPRDAALALLYETVSIAAAAAPKLMPVDPFEVHRILVGLTETFDRLADEAIQYTTGSPADLPAAGAPLIDIAAAHHAGSDIRLFAS